MKVAVIGAGVIGVSTAYFLALQGHEVTVIERRSGPGLETSFANGGLITPSMSDPWNGPGCWRQLAASLVNRAAPLQLRAKRLPKLVSWGTSFLAASRKRPFRENCFKNYRLAKYSAEVMAKIRNDIRIPYSYSGKGTLKIFRSEASLELALRHSESLRGEGLEFQKLDVQDALQLEPMLAFVAPTMCGALYYPADEVGNAHAFTQGLASTCASMGVKFLFDTEVNNLRICGGELDAIEHTSGKFQPDCCVLAAGSYSRKLANQCGVRLLIEPVKGYSVTFPDGASATGLSIPLIDDALHVVIVPIGRDLRVAGTAEFAGFDLAPNPVRIHALITLLENTFPNVNWRQRVAKEWSGLRPTSPDGVPIIGRTAIGRLYVNSGHGHLGWTMAAGSAALVSDVLGGRRPALDPSAYAPARFSFETGGEQ